MRRKIEIFIVGYGKIGKKVAEYAVKKGYNIVGIADINTDIISQKISSLVKGCKSNESVIDVKELKKALINTKPNICIILTSGLIKEIKNYILDCISLGINVLTNCEEAFYPQISSNSTYKLIHKLALKNKCTVSASGYQDIFWGNIVSIIAGGTSEIRKIIGKSTYYIDSNIDYLNDIHGIGLNIEEFNKKIAKKDYTIDFCPQKDIVDENFFPSFMWTVHGWLCSKFGFNIIKQSQSYLPIMADNDIALSNKLIKKDNVCGLNVITKTYTGENVIIESECIGIIKDNVTLKYFEQTKWIIEGEPNITIDIPKPSTLEITSASIVNRIEDVINAESGYITTERFKNIKL